MKYLSIIVSLFFISCSILGKEDIFNSSANKFSRADLIGTWNFKSYSDLKPTAFETTLEFKSELNKDKKNVLNGRAAVNYYFANYEVNENNNSLIVNTLGSTKMAGEPKAMEAELLYFTRIAKVKSYRFKDANTLILHLSEPKNETMIFVRKQN